MARTNYLFFIILVLSTLNSFAQLDFKDKIYNAEDGINGIRATEALCLDPTGEFLYVGSQRGLSLFNRDTISHELEFVKTYYYQTDGMYLMYDVESIVISCDGKYLLAAAHFSSAINVFQRDLSTGELELIKVYDNQEFSIQGINSMKFSNDCEFLYTISHLQHVIKVFSFNQLNGQLENIQTIYDNEPGGGSFLCSMELTLDNRFLYVLSSMREEVNVFSVEAESGLLNFVETEKIEHLSNSRIKVAPNGKFLYWFGRDLMSVFEINQETGEITHIKTYENGVAGVEGINGVYAAEIDVNSKYLFTMSCGDSCLSSFEIDDESGFLNQIFCQELLERKQYCGGRNYNSMVLKEDNILVSSYWESSFFNVDVDMSNGIPTDFEKFSDTQGAIINGLRNVQIVETSPDGKYVFAGTLSDGFSMFKRESTTGAIEFLDYYGGEYSDSTYNYEKVNGLLAIDDLLFVSLNKGNTGGIVIYRILENDSLEEIDFITPNDLGLPDYPGIAGYLMADESKNNIYSADDDEIYVFDYNAETSSISLSQFVDVYEIGNINFLLENIVLTNDGEYVFIHNSWNRLYSFKRNTENGHLTFLDEYLMRWYDEDDKGLYGINSMAVSNDSRHLYFTFGGENILLSFDINRETDSLDYLQKIFISDVVYNFKQDYVNLIRIDPSDNYVYTTSLTDPELLLFQRDTITGMLDLIDSFNEQENGFDGLDMASDLTFSSLGDDVYITSAPENAISTLKMGPFLGKDRHLCEGDITKLALPYNYDYYLWSTGDTSATIDVEEAGKYWVKVYDPYGFMEYDTIELFFHDIHELDLGNDTVLCENQQINLYANFPYLSYLWNTGDTLNNIWVSDSGLYSLEVTNIYGCKDMDTIKLSNEYREYDLLDSLYTICDGDSVILAPIGNYIYYNWNDSVYTSELLCKEDGQYRLEVKSENNCLYFGNTEVKKNPMPFLPEDLIVDAGQEIKLQPQGGPFEDVIWQDSIVGETFSFFPSAYSLNELIITAEMTNIYGCQHKDSILLEIDYTSPDFSYLLSNVYPNPTRDQINIQLNQFVEEIEIDIFDVSGRYITSFEFAFQSKLKIDLSFLPTGSYYLNLKMLDYKEVIKIVVSK